MPERLSEDQLINFCREELALMMGASADTIDVHANFEDLRLNSIHAMQLLDELEDRLGISISPLVFWENPTLSGFCRTIASSQR